MSKVSFSLRMLINVLLCFLLLEPNTVSAENNELAGVSIQSKMFVEGVGPALILNGAGIRYKFFFKIYVAALYLPKLKSNRLELLKELPPSRMLMHIVYDEVSKEKLVSAWVDGFQSNTNDDEYRVLEARLELFNQMFTNLHNGDVVLLDYVPDEGTKVSIKDENKGVIKGADFNRALLSVWLGDEPVTDELRSALLGLNSD